jgi:ComF family protein
MIEGLRHLLFPEVCVACGKLLDQGEEQICTECFTAFDPFPGVEAGGEALRRLVRGHFGAGAEPDEAWCLYPYRHGGRLHDALHGLKYGGLYPLGALFGRKLAGLVAGSPRSFDAVVPVPLHALKKIERTYNQSEKIAEGVAGVLGLPVLGRALVRHRFTDSQTGLDARSRSRNVRDAFSAGPIPAPRRVLLVDDVVTTGATLVAAATALKRHGAASVAFATVALTEIS